MTYPGADVPLTDKRHSVSVGFGTHFDMCQGLDTSRWRRGHRPIRAIVMPSDTLHDHEYPGVIEVAKLVEAQNAVKWVFREGRLVLLCFDIFGPFKLFCVQCYVNGRNLVKIDRNMSVFYEMPFNKTIGSE